MDILKKAYNETVYFDGGTGSVLQSMGLKAGERPEAWNISHPDRIKELHLNYFKAGSNIIKANTFGINGLKYNEKELCRLVDGALTCAQNAKKEADELLSPADRYIALDIGPLGKLLEPLGELAFEDAVCAFSKTITAGAPKADLILIETMSDAYEMKAAVLAAKENCSLPVFVTCTFDENGKMLTGADPAAAAALLEGLGADAIGMNCGLGPYEMLPIVNEFVKYASVPVIVNPNAGLPHEQKGSTVYDISPKSFAEASEKLFLAGARILGGCCGTTPEHIASMIERVNSLTPLPLIKKNRTVISSYTHAVEFDKTPVIIGERINPTGKPKLKEALRLANMEYIAEAGVSQRDAGAHALDVNVGLPDIDEPALMVSAVKTLQKTLDLPLQIDTSNPLAMEAALRIYNGKPLINSVNGKEESMKSIFPLVKKYGGVVIALTLDENGIPDSSEGRISIAKKILSAARTYGIDKKDIIFDPLTLTVSTDKNAALVTLESVSRITRELGAKTSLGVTNVSFGLPKRELVNSVFLTLALREGLSAAIMNPNSESMMNVYHGYLAAVGLDDGFAKYIGYAGEPEEKKAAPVLSLTLKSAIEKGLRGRAEEITRELIAAGEPLEIIDSEIIPALDSVGKAFEAQKLFLPQLLMSAEAAGKAFGVIRSELLKRGNAGSRKCRIVLATVKGDIHDIGKNIVKTLLENYNYDVIDLGKDVPPEAIVKAAIDTQAPVIGLSALMTTTAPAMAETIELIRAQIPGCRVIVGGAVITEEYAKKIGADAYAADAMAAVRYLEGLSSELS